MTHERWETGEGKGKQRRRASEKAGERASRKGFPGDSIEPTRLRLKVTVVLARQTAFFFQENLFAEKNTFVLTGSAVLEPDGVDGDEGAWPALHVPPDVDGDGEGLLVPADPESHLHPPGRTRRLI